MAEFLKEKQRQALSGWPMVLFFLLMLIFAAHSGTRMVAAGDTWVAMACGRHFLNHGVDTVEPFSANSHRPGPTEAELQKYPSWLRGTIKKWHPTGWVNQNWLTHVMFYWLTHESPFADAQDFSFNTLVYWKYAICILVILCVYCICRILGVNPALSAACACFAVFVGRSFIDIRPQIFTNLLVPTFLLILLLATYRNILYIWLLVPLGVFWCNVHGGYIYLFIMLVPFITIHFVTAISTKWFVSIGLRGVFQTILASIAAFIAMVIFNPFHLTNLTHTFIVSVSKHAELWRTVNEWHPAFEWTNPVGTGKPFAVMFGIFLAFLGIWLFALVLKPHQPTRTPRRENKKKDPEEYQWPRIDLPLITIAALTVYMAIRSRRFIPIAANVACPVIAMFVDQSIRMICARLNFNRTNRLIVSPMHWLLQMVLVVFAAGAVLFFGTWWGLKIKRVYLDPWPLDGKFSSVFMRLTASYAKPFYAGQFIRENKLKGNMFNYWTEGGFIAWTQEPDPNTGKTPLQLFMDGRAQAAYEAEDYKRWAAIMAGGPEVQRTTLAKREPTPSEYGKIGDWIVEQFKQHDVWVVLMPAIQYDTKFLKALELRDDWRVVFVSDKQKLLVDYSTPQGRDLVNGIFTNKTKYPDEAHKLMAIAYNLLRSNNEQAIAQGMSFATRALELSPTQTAIIEILNAVRKDPKLVQFAGDALMKYLREFDENKDRYMKEDGYAKRLLPAIVASRWLKKTAKDPEAVKYCTDKYEEYKAEQKSVFKNTQW